MKKRFFVIMSFVFAAVLGSFAGSEAAEAAVDNTGVELTITGVTDIDVYNDYKENNIIIDTAAYNAMDGLYIYKVTLEQDGFIKLLISAKHVAKTTSKSSVGISSSEGTVTATVYRDAKRMFSVAPSVTNKSNMANISSSPKIALDKGTYYIAVQADPYVFTTSGNNSSNSYARGYADMIIYYQPVSSDEIYRPSSVGRENLIKFEDVYKSFLTVPNPKDYYMFELKDKALLKINYMYDSPKSAKFTLYGPDREELLTKTFTGNNIWYNSEKYLEPGVYYCSLETTTANDGGRTSLLINQTVYPLILSQENQTTNSYITVTTIDQPVEIRWVKGKLTNSELNSSKWKNGKVITDTKLFGVNMTGYYTVRVTDEYQNMFMQSIQVTNCDKKAPSKPTILTYTAGTLEVTGSAEKNSLVTVWINGKPYTCTASAKGNYKCTLKVKLLKGDIVEANAQDISGNISGKAEVIVK